MSMPGMDGMPGMGGSGFGGGAASPAAGLPDMAGLTNIAGLGLMNLRGRDPTILPWNPVTIHKLMNLQESQYVPFGPSAG